VTSIAPTSPIPASASAEGSGTVVTVTPQLTNVPCPPGDTSAMNKSHCPSLVIYLQVVTAPAQQMKFEFCATFMLLIYNMV
jgi:NADPH:quinone reductase-like Zn-dependent oxidoreductase